MHLSLVVVILALLSTLEINSSPVNSNSAIWHKILKRDTAPKQPPSSDNNQNTTNENGKNMDKTSVGNEDELLDEKTEDGQSTSFDAQDDADRSIDWQLLTGNRADLEKELESRRRRRSVSLNRQHRIRTAANLGGRMKRSRSKRAVYQSIDPADLMAAYEYLQSRHPEEYQQLDENQQDDDVSESDLSNLASLMYELQNQQSPVDSDDADDQDILPDQEQMDPQELAALEEAAEDEGYYPKDKRSMDEPTDEDEDQPTAIIIPIPMDDQQSEFARIPLAESTYENPYDFYQLDADQADDEPDVYEEALRRLDEEELRQRIASLVDDINEQRLQAPRRRRR